MIILHIPEQTHCLSDYGDRIPGGCSTFEASLLPGATKRQVPMPKPGELCWLRSAKLESTVNAICIGFYQQQIAIVDLHECCFLRPLTDLTEPPTASTKERYIIYVKVDVNQDTGELAWHYGVKGDVGIDENLTAEIDSHIMAAVRRNNDTILERNYILEHRNLPSWLHPVENLLSLRPGGTY